MASIRNPFLITEPCRYPLEYVDLKCTATDTMPRPGPATLASLKTLFETKRGKVLPLPPKLVRLYGCLRMPLPLVMGKAFAPDDALWATLTDLRRGGRHLFLRYSFP